MRLAQCGQTILYVLMVGSVFSIKWRKETFLRGALEFAFSSGCSLVSCTAPRAALRLSTPEISPWPVGKVLEKTPTGFAAPWQIRNRPGQDNVLILSIIMLQNKD
jgi:hypothetical protein